MGISQALYTGVTGLSVNSDGMSVIANNIANANDKGFKYDRAEFEDLLSLDTGSGAGTAQIGRGSKLSDVRTVHTQGGLAVTERLTDLAVQGKGFFVVKNSAGLKQEAGGMFYTRTGTFNFDRDGYLADATGGHIQGYEANSDGTLQTRLTDIRIQTNNIPPAMTNTVVMNVNLDSRIEVKEGEFDIKNAEKTSDFNNTVTIYDSHGNKHDMTTFFKRVEDGEGITWKWYATVDGKDVTDADKDAKYAQIANGVVKFNPKGELLSEETLESNANFTKGATPGQKISIDFGKNLATEGGNGVGASASTAARSNTVFHSQDGYESGNIKSLAIELDGTVHGYYTNGVERTLAAVALATFENDDGLLKAGRNQFYKTQESGDPRIGQAQTGTRGSIFSSSLEESNVDLAAQFVQMIVTQRGFQANSRSVTTTDSMIEEVVNMKR